MHRHQLFVKKNIKSVQAVWQLNVAFRSSICEAPIGLLRLKGCVLLGCCLGELQRLPGVREPAPLAWLPAGSSSGHCHCEAQAAQVAKASLAARQGQLQAWSRQA